MVEKLITALEGTILFLRNSQSSDWASVSVEEIIPQLEAEINKAGKSQPINANLLSLLFAPTGAIQEIAIDNGWGNEFLRVSQIIEQFTRRD